MEKELTIEKLCSFKRHEHYTNQEAVKIISSINTLTSILAEIYKKEYKEEVSEGGPKFK